MSTETVFWLICAAAVCIMLIYHDRRRKRLLSLLSGAVTGLAALMLVNCFGGYIGADVPLNLFNLCGSAVLGAPFVLCMTVLQYF